ncbi:MAG: murC ddl [Parachlamydiales bacterium]|nr:murC ddl [Parachlamydiales bacterium]
MTYHFIGMGGIGMSALARILLQQGQKVQGSDIKKSALLDQLQREGAQVQIGHTAVALQSGDTVIYSTDINQENVELQKAKDLKLIVLHRSDLLDRLMENQKPLLVTGTHGKTTTTALLAAVLIEAKLDPTFVVGGIMRSLDTNGRAGLGPYFVAEADESDGSFLKTPSFGAIVTNLEKEHLGYWKTHENLSDGFRKFFAQVKNHSHLFWCYDDPGLRSLEPPGASYGFSNDAECRIEAFTQSEKGIRFDLTIKNKRYSRIEVALYGRHNALNAAAVFALAMSLKLSEEAVRRALESFGGTARRLELVGEMQKIQVYDDYGHHPTEISVTLSALRDRVRERRLVVIVQPHRFTRVRDMFEEFLQCFVEADELILTDIYSAGEPPIEGITSAALYTRLREKMGPRVRFFPRQHLESGVAALLRPGDAVITIGAGDITTTGKILLNLIAEHPPKLTVGVLFGGTSSEHEISLLSARNIVVALDPSLYFVKLFGITKDGAWISGDDAFKKIDQKMRIGRDVLISPAILEELNQCDVCIPVFHGPQGEDGMIQGMLDTLDIPYAGCDYRAGAICMHKAWTKHVAMINGVPTAPYVEGNAASWRRNPDQLLGKIAQNLTYPLWVKPVHLGSSIGVSRVENWQELKTAVEKAFQLDDCIIVEKEIAGRQIEFAVLGNEYIRIGAPGEILNHGQFYDYDKKYGPQAMKGQTPADLTGVQQQIGRELATRMYESCGCKGLARVDFFLDANGHYWLNEINPFPGFTANSLYPKMWEAAGLTQRQQCDELVILSLQRHRRLAEIRGK